MVFPVLGNRTRFNRPPAKFSLKNIKRPPGAVHRMPGIPETVLRGLFCCRSIVLSIVAPKRHAAILPHCHGCESVSMLIPSPRAGMGPQLRSAAFNRYELYSAITFLSLKDGSGGFPGMKKAGLCRHTASGTMSLQPYAPGSRMATGLKQRFFTTSLFFDHFGVPPLHRASVKTSKKWL